MSQAVRLEDDSLWLSLYLQPKASRDQFSGRHGDEMRLAITAPPVAGQANAHLIKWLAKRCRVPKSRVSIIGGETSRHKRVRVVQPREIPAELADLLADSA
ncbi:DUF167 family protein YggU [Zobellella aerophila]|uniref:UPF0235 protein GCM10022394_27830 n=1 Tax=Zobellella aerophila TaxID=870480 RepID=A0ABP6W8G9_9GAMM